MSFATPSHAAWDAFILSRFGDGGRLAKRDATLTALLDHELEILQDPRTLASARRLRNASSSFACSLPAEVLSRIFWFLQPDWIPSQNWQRGGGGLGWTAVCHVCSRWREVALSSSSLWCEIYCYGFPIRSIPAILARSRQTKLRLFFHGPDHVDGSPSDDIPGIWICPPVCHRMSELVIVESKSRFLQTWIPLLRTSMPDLTRLVFNLTVAPLSLDDVLLPLELFNSPQLSIIDVLDCHIPWLSPLPSTANLTQLRLQATHPPQIALRPSFLQLRDVIARARALEDLTLCNIFPISHGAPFGAEYTVPLPDSLISMDLLARSFEVVNDCLATLLLLVLPHKSKARVRTEVCAGAEPSLVSLVMPHFFLAPPDGCLELHVGRRCVVLTLSAMWLAGFSSDGIEWARHKWARGERRLHIPGNNENEASRDNTNSLVSYLPLLDMGQVYRLAITGDAVLAFQDGKEWMTTFAKAAHVDQLALHFAQNLLPLLCALAESPPAGPTHEFALFPFLKVIAIFREKDEVGNEVEINHKRSVALQISLTNLVYTRKFAGRPLQKLRIHCGLLDEDALVLLKEMVDVDILNS
ncbi:unnamed protein product [Peniophora sp. CBMAI 1063]|nr:unnamed protein product [Peniophora sp. CBMAI 1063]